MSDFFINVAPFTKDLDNFKDTVKKDLVKLHKETAFQILKRLLSHGRFIGATPVDTGRAISNWRLDIDKVDLSTIDQIDETGQQAFNFTVGKLSKLKEFQVIWITNNLPYIDRIMNQGWSKQTPRGSIALTIAEVIQFLQQKYKE